MGYTVQQQQYPMLSETNFKVKGHGPPPIIHHFPQSNYNPCCHHLQQYLYVMVKSFLTECINDAILDIKDTWLSVLVFC